MELQKYRCFASNRRNRSPNTRSGTAAVEAALIMPVVVVVFLGAIDIAQYINLSQVVANASREGARVASRATTNDVQTVEDAVLDYLRDSYPQLDTASFNTAASVDVEYDGAPITDENMNNVVSGDAITVEVSFDFAEVRWLPGLDYWDGNVNTSTTVCRRQ